MERNATNSAKLSELWHEKEKTEKELEEKMVRWVMKLDCGKNLSTNII